MTDYGRIIATLIIWTSIACIFIFGLFAQNWSGHLGGLMYMNISVTLACAAAGSTVAVWYKKFPDDKKGQSQRPSP